MADDNQKDPNADRKAYLKGLFPDWSDEKIQEQMDKSANPQNFVKPVNVTSAMNVGKPSPISSDPYQNTAQVLTGGGQPPPQPMSEGGVVNSKLDAIKRLKNYKRS